MILGTYHFTNHALFKMAFYGLSEGRVRRVIKSSTRVEEGIAPDTVAMMQPSSIKIKQGVKTWNQEIWVMVGTGKNARREANDKKLQQKKLSSDSNRLIVISAWRYPGMSKSRAALPQAILDEIHEALRTLS